MSDEPAMYISAMIPVIRVESCPFSSHMSPPPFFHVYFGPLGEYLTYKAINNFLE